MFKNLKKLYEHQSYNSGSKMDSRSKFEQYKINKSNASVLYKSKMPAGAVGGSINELNWKLFIQFFRNAWSVWFQVVYLVNAWPGCKMLKSFSVWILVWEGAL